MPKFLQSVDENSADTIAPRSRSPLKFLLLVFGLPVPFWLTGAVTRLQLLPVGVDRHSHMGTTNVSSIQKCLTGSAALHPSLNRQWLTSGCKL
jgi:hypothetical protein